MKSVEGYVSSKKYFLAAMNIYREKYNTENQAVLFILATDDTKWATMMFGNLTDVKFTASAPKEFNERQPTFDLATMSFCNHSIFR
jgi:hypothetical protein